MRSMEGGPTVAARQNLLDRLLDAIKQCQVHFGARQEIATETDLRVATLCTEWEAVLLHGSKKKPKSSLRQMAGLASQVSLWQLARLCLSTEESKRFMELQNVGSDIGRGRAWLRAAINERTLENYLHCVLTDETKLKQLYEPHAFLLDQERSSMLPVMAGGLKSILFSIPIDASYLNSPARSVDVPAVVPQLRPSQMTQPPLLDRRPLEDGPEDDSVVAVSAKEKKKKHKRKCPPEPLRPSPSPELPDSQESAQEGDMLEMGVASLEMGGATLLVGGAPDSLSSSPSMLSVSSTAEEGEPPIFVALDTSSDPASSEAEAAASATALVLSATSQHSAQIPDGNALSPEELREALLAMVKAKMEVEELNKQLEVQLSDLLVSREQLVSELEAARGELRGLQEARDSQQQALERENDLLREQLRKYVGMVQAQRKDPASKTNDSSPASLPVPDSTLGVKQQPQQLQQQQPPEQHQLEQPSVPSNLEQKLSEMAELYGELMELNERLHRDIASKDTVICKLASCIRKARIKLPVPVEQLPPGALELESVVDIWIPSVIKRGRGPEAHHVYQVFVKVRSEEWNVYRRYNEFREFHRQLQRCIPEAASFSFPPKKAIGNKSSQVVEERRLKLQEYLRFVARLCQSYGMQRDKGKGKGRRAQAAEPIIKPDITKEALTVILPFFKEDMDVELPKPRSPSYSGL